VTGPLPEVVARAAGGLGEVVLRRRPAPGGPRTVDCHLYLSTVREGPCT
jgi:hypothetical protein